MSEMSDAEEDASFSMSDVAVRESLTHLKVIRQSMCLFS